MFSRLWLSAFTLTDTAHINTLYRQKMAGTVEYNTKLELEEVSVMLWSVLIL